MIIWLAHGIGISLKKKMIVLGEITIIRIGKKCNNFKWDKWKTRFNRHLESEKPQKTRFTWRRKKPVIQSRIDRFYISDTMQYNISKADIIPGIRSDHSAIVLSIKPTKSIEEGGPNFRKFNNSLLNNTDFTNGLKLICRKWHK